MKVRIVLQEEMLGTASANPDLYRDFIASKRPEGVDEQEIEDLPDVDEELGRQMTVFPRENDHPFLYDYQLKGFFKDACGMLRRVEGTASSKLKAYKKLIDGLIFVKPRKIIMKVSEIGICERPLRAQTPQGERVALARSETVPAGTTLQFEIVCLDKKLENAVEEWLNYGELRGLGQWRNSGAGRFSWVRLEDCKLS